MGGNSDAFENLKKRKNKLGKSAPSRFSFCMCGALKKEHTHTHTQRGIRRHRRIFSSSKLLIIRKRGGGGGGDSFVLKIDPSDGEKTLSQQQQGKKRHLLRRFKYIAYDHTHTQRKQMWRSGCIFFCKNSVTKIILTFYHRFRQLE